MTVDPDLRITISDVRAAGHCGPGAWNWFQEHSLDFRDFIKHGISAQVFLDKGDALAEQVVARKLERDNG